MSACKKREPVSWDSDLLVPIMHSTLDVWDLFGDTNVVENSDQSLRLVVEEKVDMLDPDKVIEVHDTLAVDLFNIPLHLKFAPGQQLTQRQTSVSMDLGDMELTEARARVASLKFYVTNTIKEPLQVKYELLSSDKDGKHFEVYEDIPPATSLGPSYTVKTIHLDGYDMDMTGDGTQVNTVRSQTTVWIHPDADSIWITPSDTILIISTFDELNIDYTRGYFGQQTYQGQGSSYISVFNNFKAGSFNLDMANANLTIRNYTGMDVQMNMSKLATYNSALNQEILLNHPIIGQSLNVGRATENGPNLSDVQPTISKYKIENSNLDKLIELQPDSLRFKMSALINPMGNVSAGNDFMYFEKGVEAIIEMEIPLKFSANNLQIEDYSTLNFDDKGKLKSGELRVYTINRFPLSLEIQFYILDDDRNIVDSLFMEKPLIPSAHVDGQGYVIAPSTKTLVVPLTQSRINHLRKYSDILIRANVNSYENRSLQLYESHNLDIQIVGDVKYEL
ncbi:MAG: hypothetical protein KAG64_08435 [Bacteroidales bacterium]|nr:hypothetical protein [Bacteroidales bacterium]